MVFAVPWRSPVSRSAATLQAFIIVSAVLAGAGGAAPNPLFDRERTQLWRQDSFGLPFEEPESGDEFGRALASGDFDCDGYDDLAIGVPLEDLAVGQRAGAVHIVFGGLSGLESLGSRYLTEDDLQGGASSAGAEFGKVLASGDFDQNGCDDLAIGVPEFDGGGLADSGAAWVVPGAGGGPELTLARHWTQEGSGVQGVREALDHFGSALLASDLNGDGFDDLVVAAFGEALDQPNQGAIWLLPGSSTGLLDADEDPVTWRQLVHQNLTWVNETAEANDLFGASLAACDFDGNGLHALVVGVPGEDDPDPGRGGGGPRVDSGAVQVFFTDSFGVDSFAEPSLVRGFDDDLRMGFAVVAGRFDPDKADQCFVAASGPFYDLFGHQQSGVASILGNIAPGEGDIFTSPSQTTFGAVPEFSDHFGWSMATGRFSAIGEATDWVVSAPFEDVEGEVGSDHGVVHVAFGNYSHFRSSHQGELSHQFPLTEGSRFGEAVAVGDFDGDGFDDLAVSAPRTTLFFQGSFIPRAGVVQVHYASGLTFLGDFEDGDTSGWSVSVP